MCTFYMMFSMLYLSISLEGVLLGRLIIILAVNKVNKVMLNKSSLIFNRL